MGGGVETDMRGTRCPLKGHSMRVGADVGDENTESRSVIQPPRTPSAFPPERPTALLLSVEL